MTHSMPATSSPQYSKPIKANTLPIPMPASPTDSSKNKTPLLSNWKSSNFFPKRKIPPFMNTVPRTRNLRWPVAVKLNKTWTIHSTIDPPSAPPLPKNKKIRSTNLRTSASRSKAASTGRGRNFQTSCGKYPKKSIRKSSSYASRTTWAPPSPTLSKKENPLDRTPQLNSMPLFPRSATKHKRNFSTPPPRVATQEKPSHLSKKCENPWTTQQNYHSSKSQRYVIPRSTSDRSTPSVFSASQPKI